ncbi:MAG: hypothetical protein FWC59_00105 [Actinomycetia bacterium]|nr:hypothetical protein [Actinomycetes bacterium]
MTDELENDLPGVVLSDEVIGELSDEDPVESAVFFAFDEASTKLETEGGFEPFLVTMRGEELFVEELEGDDEADIIAAAHQTVTEMTVLINAYIFTYDGYVDLEEGTGDAIILEYARKGEAEAQVLAWLYETQDDELHFKEPLYSLGTTTTLFSVSGQDESEPEEAPTEETLTTESAANQPAAAQSAVDGSPVGGSVTQPAAVNSAKPPTAKKNARS